MVHTTHVERRIRLRNNTLIVGFLALQIIGPLSYYLGGRGPDERFSWRMFSTVRMHRCRVEVEALDSPDDAAHARILHPRRDVQVAWVNMLTRYRPAVVDKYLARSCDREQVDRVRYRRSCRTSDGSPLAVNEVVRSCRSGETTTREVAP